jgi:uncharacterized protein (TIGR02453 family)
MKTPIITKSTISFLKKLSANNNREWFNKNKSLYLDAHQNMCSFVDALIVEMNKHDNIENESGRKSLYRIYSDVRFSKDKSPYNPRFAFSLQRATKLLRGGYYVNVSPGNSFMAAGFFGPNPDDLKKIRLDISYNYQDWNRIIKSNKINDNFGGLVGEKVPTSPRGFQIDHPAIDLLRQKQFILKHKFSDKEVISDSFIKDLNNLFKSVRPFFNYMSEVLTTDSNGEIFV